ncbi:SpoIIE family protein phosphatase [Mycolicibacterium hodleri]|uniref:GAF domain-containing protein n=1 Tax=Mycolicibacterium hodleri TaxID=49897 RepID=A0A502E4H6_9MYCO|nr:SpoIIE family protein phosphatase [Mycolicibacterium hodleri]TPG32543.1 GAF domain-containing protein [Mycolicibacterium hodleri]
MTESTVQISTDEQARLDECAIEQIHLPGSIQPHGALIAVDASSFEIRQVSANSAAMLGVEPSELLGRSVQLLLGEQWLRNVLGREDDRLANPHLAEVGGNLFDVIVHRSASMIIVEFEAVSTTDAHLLPALNAALRRVSAMRTMETLRECAAREIRALVRFDRVVVYHFYPDGHGEVVAEDRVPELEPYLHQHFPASDIPVQARSLYLKKASQLIASSDYEPVPLIPAHNPATGEPLDLSRAELRSVSPHHLRYMRNMGTAATISLSLLQEGELIGMITCSAQEPRVVSYVHRQACEILAQQMTLQLGALAQRQHHERQIEYQLVRSELVQQMLGNGDIPSGLCSGNVTLVDLVQADGAIARIGGRMMSVGVTLSAAQALELARWVVNADEPVHICSDALGSERADLAELVPSAAGMVLWQCGPRGDFLAWFRGEVLQTIDWIGDQTLQNRDDPFSPRNSFAMWRQSVTGRSTPWLPDDIAQIGELIRDIDGVRAQQAATSDLNRGREVQRALHPKETAPSVGYDVAGACMPARTVGGDFYDWYSTEDGLAITLGDVMGKGVGAAMIAAAVRTLMRVDRNNRDPSIAVAHASSMLNADLAEVSSFATLFHALLTSATGEVSYIDAGHGLTIILRRDGSSVRLSGGDYPIGLALGGGFSRQFEVLDPGDMLVSFSDGVLDLYDDSLDAIEAIVALARQAPSPQSLVESVMNLAGALTMPDDVTVVAVRRNRG